MTTRSLAGCMTHMSFIKRIKRNGKVYLAEVESKRVNGKVIHKYIRYIGKEADGKTKLAASISDIEIDEVKLYGPLLVLHHLANEIGLPQLLGKYSNELLSLVYAHCLDYKSINKMEKWFARTDLSFLLNIESVTEKKLLTALDSLDQIDTEKLQRDLFSNITKKIPVRKKSLIYDVTNTYFYGKKCPLAKRGHDKEGVKGRPLIQIGLAVTQDKGIPLFHKLFHGNIHDTKTLSDLVSTLGGYHIFSGCLVYDRGIVSAENIKEIAKLGLDTLCGLPLHDNLKRIIRKLNKKKMMDIRNRVELSKTIFYVTTVPYVYDSVKGTLTVCFNEQQHRDLKEMRCMKLLKAEKLLKNNKKINSKLEHFFNKNGTINRKKISDAEEFDGYSCVFYTGKMPQDKMIRFYFDKDVVEKAFHSLKGITQLRPIRHWLHSRVTAHVMICYLSYSLLSMIKNYVEPLGMSPLSALEQLETMHKIYMRDVKKQFKISRIVTLSKLQKDILRAINPKLLKCSQ